MTIIFGSTIISKSYVYCPGGFARHLLQMDLKLGCIESPPQKKSNSKNAVLMNLVAGHFRLDPFLAPPVLFFLLSLFAILRTLVPRFCLAWPILRDARDMFLHIASPQEDRKVKSYFLTKHGMSCDLCLSLWGLL